MCRVIEHARVAGRGDWMSSSQEVDMDCRSPTFWRTWLHVIHRGGEHHADDE